MTPGFSVSHTVYGTLKLPSGPFLLPVCTKFPPQLPSCSRKEESGSINVLSRIGTADGGLKCVGRARTVLLPSTKRRPLVSSCYSSTIQYSA